jgi:hypothetical protein
VKDPVYKHVKACFEQLLNREKDFCGDCAVFYHSYSDAALLYEVQAALASVLFNFPSSDASLPRILFDRFVETPNAPKLLKSFNQNFRVNKTFDGHSSFMDVGLSVMCSLAAKGPEASPLGDFVEGYRDSWGVSHRRLLMEVLESCRMSRQRMEQLMEDVLAVAQKHGLDASSYGGHSRAGPTGHLLQIFVPRELVDHLAYAAHPFGAVDKSRQPLSQWLDGGSSLEWGQARLVANPEYFGKPSAVRMFTASANSQFHATRGMFQRDLRALISKALSTDEAKHRAATALYGGVLPEWLQD